MRIETIEKFDLAFSLFCLSHRFNHPVAKISKLISRTGDGYLYVAGALYVWFWRPELAHLFVLTGVIAFAIELPIYWLSKNTFRRRRPQELSRLFTSYITPSDRYSLPSGHTAAAFVMASVIGHYFPDMYAAAVLWAALIGASRIFLGVHFLTDVIVGALLGIGCANTAMLIIGS